MKENEKI